MGRRHRSFVLCMMVLALLALLPTAVPASADEPPSVRLFASASRITTIRERRDFVYVDPGVWIAPVAGTFELRATRPDYDTPVGLRQTDAATGAELRPLPADLLEGWFGLRDFVHYSVRDMDGALVLRGSIPFCPNTWNRTRISDEGPLNPRYPFFCGGNPFTRGAVWGIDEGWAASAFGDFYGFGWRASRRHYRVRVWIDPVYVDLLGIGPTDAETRVHVTAVDQGQRDVPLPAAPLGRPGSRVPTVTAPTQASLPDLVALPAWGIGTYSRRGRDYLAFNATEWNAGPGTLVVEGFRQVDEDLMDAYQYFLVDGEPVGRAPIGEMEFHAAHFHWHFRQFTEYSLLDAAGERVLLSGKQSWCLANTDAIDLAVPNANWGAYGGDLFTMCGGPGALWIREILDVGWGDTYSQFVAGQAFDITELPNGTYHIRVRVNPTGSILEGSTENNVEDRQVRIKGKPGDRSVVVPAWHGIDTEGGCYGCF